MKFSELVEYCEEIHVNCTECEKEDCCMNFQNRIEDISPMGLMMFVKDDENIDEDM